jgi:DNA-binding GntR family transcriptional regulator
VASPVEVARAQRELPPLQTVVLDGASARSQSERAYLLIRDQIVTLKLRPGAVIEESRLRQELQLGRTPIREALQRLAHEKLVTFVPHRGTFVTDINITDLARLTEVRVELEGYAARLAAERATPQDREALQLLRNELAELDGDPEGLIHLDQRIHRMVYRASHNRFLEDVCERYFNLSLRLWFLALHRVPLKNAVEEQRESLDAVLARDPARAQAALRRHVTDFEQEIRRVL